ncbi:MAG: flavodoxin family protein [Eggerthella lenta]
MGKNVLVVSASLRPTSNSHALALAFAEGAREAGHDVETVSLRGKRIEFCRGCLACQAGAACPLKDDAAAIVERIVAADAIAFATPIYFFEMAGQMKTLLDRSNPAYAADPAFRDVYLLATAADETPMRSTGRRRDCRLGRLLRAGTPRGRGDRHEVDAPGAIEKRLHEVNRARLMGCGV